MGSASLFFLIQPHRAFLSDSCSDLVATFQAVRDNPRGILRYLLSWRPDPDFFYQVRGDRSSTRIRRAAEFIYLNKTCWNGLYRVNSEGEFNVPYGRPKTSNIIDPENLRACSRLLRRPHIQIEAADFAECARSVREDDLVFLDPPYVTRHNNNGFVDYNEKIFSWQDQIRLAKVAKTLVRRGAHVMVTNAAHRDVIDLYSGFECLEINRSSSIAANSLRRGQVSEVLLVGGRRGTD